MTNVTPIDAVSIYCGESTENDKVYKCNANTMNMFPKITDDSDFRDTDYKMNIFSSMGNNMKTIYQNNITTPIRSKHTLTALGSGYNLSDGVGVYIVETFTLSTKAGIDVNELLTHYLQDDVMTVSKSVKVQIVELIKVEAKRSRNAIPLTIRLFTFIPKPIIDHHTSIYVPSCNVVITKCSYDRLPLHPWSETRLNHDSESRLASQPANVISIDITDHSNSETGVSDDNVKIGRSFYMSIGDKVHKLSSSTDKITPSGATIVLKKQGSITDVISNIKIEDLEEHGIFTNEADAIYHGDNKLQIEDARLKHDLQKLTLDREKLKVSHNEYKKEAKLKRKKLKHDIKKLQVDSNNLARNSMHEITKLEHELLKQKHELVMMAKKYTIETLTNEYKISGLLLDMSKDKQKHIFESFRNEQKYDLDSKRAAEKHTHDMDKSHIDGIWKGVASAIVVLKSVITKKK